MGDANYLVEMGARISLKRKGKSLTQEELAEKVGVSLQTISNIECGKKAARPESIAKICMALNTTADFIMLGRREETDLEGIIKTISELPENEYRVITDIVGVFLSRAS